KPDNVLVLMRPPAHDALYHRFQNTMFDEAVAMLQAREDVQVILLPRNEAQRAMYSGKDRVIVPATSIYAGDWAAVDEELVREGRLQRITDLQTLSIHKKHKISPRRSVDVIEEVVRLIFE